MRASPSKIVTRIDPPVSSPEVLDRQAEDPTPEQIEHRAAEIRNQWSDRVKKKRHLRAPVRWAVPQVPTAEIDFT
jgi:hypothetical protein